jgi:ribosome-binding factor A
LAHAPKNVKKAQKESVLLREIAGLFSNIMFDDSRLAGLFISRVQLSPDGGLCYVYFFTSKGKEDFKEKLEFLKLYKPSLRKAIAQKLQARYTPDLKFEYDEQFEKEQKMNDLMDKLREEGKF